MSDYPPVMFEGRPWHESSPDPVEPPGSLDFNCYGIAGCVRCGWRGIPTRTGGRRTGPPRRHFEGGSAGSAVVDSTVLDECPGCDLPAYGLRLAAPFPLLEVDDYDGPRHARLVADIREWILAGQPTVRAIPKVGRNEPCPCESGRKFKKCHGAAA